MADITLEPMKLGEFSVTIIGTTPLIVHRFSEKAKAMLSSKKTEGVGASRKMRELVDPEVEADAGSYLLEDGSQGLPLTALKKAIVGGAHKDLGLPKTVVQSSLFLFADGYEQRDGSPLIRINAPSYRTREDMVRVGNDASDVRWRREYPAGWTATVRIQFDSAKLNASNIVNLIERAGFGVGLCEWRPERGGEFGRFAVKVG